MAEAAPTAREVGLAQTFYKQFGISPSQDQIVAFAAWLRQESGNGNSYNNPLNVGGGGPLTTGKAANGFNAYASEADGVTAAADRIKMYAAKNTFGYGDIQKAILSGDDAGLVDAITRSKWDTSQYGLQVIHGFLQSHLIARYYAMGGTGGTNPGAQIGGAVGETVAPVAGAAGSVIQAVSFGATAAAFVLDPQHWISLLAFMGGLVAVGVGGYMLWQSTGGGAPVGG